MDDKNDHNEKLAATVNELIIQKAWFKENLPLIANEKKPMERKRMMEFCIGEIGKMAGTMLTLDMIKKSREDPEQKQPDEKPAARKAKVKADAAQITDADAEDAPKIDPMEEKLKNYRQILGEYKAALSDTVKSFKDDPEKYDLEDQFFSCVEMVNRINHTEEAIAKLEDALNKKAPVGQDQQERVGNAQSLNGWAGSVAAAKGSRGTGEAKAAAENTLKNDRPNKE